MQREIKLNSIYDKAFKSVPQNRRIQSIARRIWYSHEGDFHFETFEELIAMCRKNGHIHDALVLAEILSIEIPDLSLEEVDNVSNSEHLEIFIKKFGKKVFERIPHIKIRFMREEAKKRFAK